MFANLGSDLCVKVDESRENIRFSLENCDVDADIQDYIGRKATGSTPLSPLPYVPYGSPSNSLNNLAAGASGFQDHSTRFANEEKELVNYSLGNYASIDTTAVRSSKPKYYIALYDYKPVVEQEVALKANDRVLVSHKDEDGWWTGKNLNTGAEGLFPASYVNPE